MSARNDAYVQAAINGERARLAAATPGSRNNTLFRCAASLASLDIREGDVLRHLRPAAEAIGLRPREFYTTVKSAMKIGRARLRLLPANPGGIRMINSALCQSGDKHARPNATSSITKSPAVIASSELPRFNNETRRHTFLRKGEPVRVKVKKEAGDYANWYRVAQGWQAAKPAGYIDCPYFVSVDPFDPELASQILFWPEGEKDCDSLAARGELAFCFGGCGDGLPNFDTKILVDRHLVILADNDELGRLHAERKAMLAHPIAASVRIVHFPELPPKGDVSDWLERGNSIEALRQKVEEASEWVPNSSDASPADTESHFSWEEPDLSIIDDRRGALPELPLDAVPHSWRNWLNRSAHGAGVTEGHVFVPLLSIASSLVGTSRRIQASRSWTEPMTMWTAVVGFSGTGKTPGIDVTKRALAEVQKLKASSVAALQRQHDTKREEAKIAKKLWTDSVEDAVANGLPAPPMPENATDVPSFTSPRLYVSDATVERLAVMLQSRPSGALYIADELAGLFLNMGRYSGGSDKEFWLEAWNGKPFVVERMGRPAVNLDHLLIGITGGLQPDKLQRSFGGDGDGMYARLLYTWPAEPKYRPLTNDVAEIEPEIVNALSRLVDLTPFGEPLCTRSIVIDPVAVGDFEQFRQFLHTTKNGFDGREREWWSKGEAHVLRLAGTLTYLEWAIGSAAEPTVITLAHIRSAICLFKEYFWPHARASLRQIGLSEKHATARRVLRWIKANKAAGEEISITDIRREALSQSIDENGALNLIEQLEGAYWLRRVQAEQTGGRPRRRWEANPKLF